MLIKTAWMHIFAEMVLAQLDKPNTCIFNAWELTGILGLKYHLH